MERDHRALVARFYDEILGAHNLGLVDELFAPDFREHGEPPAVGHEGMKSFLRMLGGAFPDLQFNVDDWIVADDKVVARGSATGTHRGEFFGVAATGKPVRWTAIHIWRIEGGRIADRWSEANVLSIMQQLGAI
jgi:steroid delta-isomerase-like uncharacterized protein